jgi:hypothetical protein
VRGSPLLRGQNLDIYISQPCDVIHDNTANKYYNGLKNLIRYFSCLERPVCQYLRTKRHCDGDMVDEIWPSVYLRFGPLLMLGLASLRFGRVRLASRQQYYILYCAANLIILYQ